MAGERLPARLSLRSQHCLRWTGKYFETATSHMQTVSQNLKKRESVKRRSEYRCEDCGATNVVLEVHHCYYLFGYEPWEYPTGSLRCLCRTCHESRDLVEKKHRGQIANLTQNELDILNKFFTNGLYWYPRKELFNLIESIGYDTEIMKSALDNLISKRLIPNN